MQTQNMAKYKFDSVHDCTGGSGEMDALFGSIDGDLIYFFEVRILMESYSHLYLSWKAVENPYSLMVIEIF